MSFLKSTQKTQLNVRFSFRKAKITFKLQILKSTLRLQDCATPARHSSVHLIIHTLAPTKTQRKSQRSLAQWELLLYNRTTLELPGHIAKRGGHAVFCGFLAILFLFTVWTTLQTLE